MVQGCEQLNMKGQVPTTLSRAGNSPIDQQVA